MNTTAEKDNLSSCFETLRLGALRSYHRYVVNMYGANNATSKNKYVDYLNLPTPGWKRPEGPPRVWRVIEGRRKTPDGETLRFSIQEVPNDLEDEVVEFMLNHFAIEEPISVDAGLVKDPLAVREARSLWTHLVRQGLSVLALKLISDPNEKPVIAGCNILSISLAEDDSEPEGPMPFRSEPLKKIITTLSTMSKEANVMKKYGVDRYMSAFGLSVSSAFRGQGLGDELLRARHDIGIAYQIPITETSFTATASQFLASRNGFELLLERNYSEIVDDEGKPLFPSVTVKSLRVMAKRLY